MLRLRESREKMELSQTEVAKKLNLSRQAYNFYENGKRDPDTETLVALADFFGVTTDYLLGRAPQEKQPHEKFSPEEIVLIKKYRQLDADGRYEIMGIIDLKLGTKKERRASSLSIAS